MATETPDDDLALIPADGRGWQRTLRYLAAIWAIALWALGLVLLLVAMFQGVVILDRTVADRHVVSLDVGDRWEERRKNGRIWRQGVLIHRPGRDWERLQSDTLARFANTGTHTAHASNWLDRVVSVDAAGRTVEAGEPITDNATWLAGSLAIIAALIWLGRKRMLRPLLRQSLRWGTPNNGVPAPTEAPIDSGPTAVSS